MPRSKRNATTERVFLFFKNYVRQHHRAPAIRDIARGIAAESGAPVSTSVVNYHLGKLVEQGRLGRSDDHSARAYFLRERASLTAPAADVPEVLPLPVDPVVVLPEPLIPARLYLDLLRTLPDRRCASIVFDQAIAALPETHRLAYRFLQEHNRPRRRADIAAHLGLLPRQISPAIRDLGALRLIDGVVDQRNGESVVVYSAVSFDSLFRPGVHP